MTAPGAERLKGLVRRLRELPAPQREALWLSLREEGLESLLGTWRALPWEPAARAAARDLLLELAALAEDHGTLEEAAALRLRARQVWIGSS